MKLLNVPFDKQEDIYPKILAMLDEAITCFSASTLVYETGDLIYPTGDAPSQAAAWLKAARGMKARYTLHLCKLDPTSWASALTLINAGALASNADDMQFAFGENVGQQNPLFQFMDQRGDIAMHKTFIDILNQRFDPEEPHTPHKQLIQIILTWAPTGEQQLILFLYPGRLGALPVAYHQVWPQLTLQFFSLHTPNACLSKLSASIRPILPIRR